MPVADRIDRGRPHRRAVDVLDDLRLSDGRRPGRQRSARKPLARSPVRTLTLRPSTALTRAYARGVAGIQFLLNGKTVRVENPPAQMTLLDFVRARGLTGAKEGCAEGECGACAVALVEPDERGLPRAAPRGSRYRVVNSCLMFLPMAAGREIYTVESLAVDGELCEAQRAMAAAGGSQCGYCTPGFVVSLFAEHYRRDRERTMRHDGAGRQSLPMHRLSSYPRCGSFARACAARRVSRSGSIGRRFRSARSRSGGFRRPATVDECLAPAARGSRCEARRGRDRPGRRVQPVRAAMAAPDQRGGDR